MSRQRRKKPKQQPLLTTTTDALEAVQVHVEWARAFNLCLGSVRGHGCWRLNPALVENWERECWLLNPTSVENWGHGYWRSNLTLVGLEHGCSRANSWFESDNSLVKHQDENFNKSYLRSAGNLLHDSLSLRRFPVLRR
jgi:hypothetical protein